MYYMFSYRVFTPEEFESLVFKSKNPVILDEEFLKKWQDDIFIDEKTKFTNLDLWLVRGKYLDAITFLLKNNADNFSVLARIIYEAITSKDAIIVKCVLNTYIYPEDYINFCYECADRDGQLTSIIKELLIDYRQFPTIKACKN